MVLRCLFRYLTHKVVDDFHFLLFLSIHFLHFADYNPADQTVQHGFVQFLNGSILADFMDKGCTSLSLDSVRRISRDRSCRRFRFASCSCSIAEVSFRKRCSDKIPFALSVYRFKNNGHYRLFRKLWIHGCRPCSERWNRPYAWYSWK